MKRLLAKTSLLLAQFANGYDNLERMQDSSEELLVLTLGGERSPDVFAFSPLSLQEQKIPNAKIARKAGGAIYYNSSLITCGGVSEDPRDRSILTTCTQYTTNLRELQSTNIPSLPLPLQYFSVIEYSHQLMIIGGTYTDATTQTRQRSQTVYKLDNFGAGWLPFNNLTTARSSHKCTVIFPDNSFFVDVTQEPSQDVYCFGGLTNKGRSNQLEILKYETDKWQTGAPMTIARSAFAATSYKSKIYVTGGKNNDGEIEDTVDIYDVRDEKWRLFAPKMSMKRYYHTCFYLDGYLFLRGGTNKQDSEHARRSIELISIDKFTGTPGTEFMDFHTSYEGKSLHNSVIVPKSFLPGILSENNDYQDVTTAAVEEQWEDEEDVTEPVLYGQVEANPGVDLAAHLRQLSKLKALEEQAAKMAQDGNASTQGTPTIEEAVVIVEVEAEKHYDDSGHAHGNDTASAASSQCMTVLIVFFTSVLLQVL